METSTPTWRQLRLPVAFALVTGVLLIVAWISFGGSAPLGPHGYRVAIPVGDASNLVPGSDVQISGVKVGEVVSIERDGTEPLVEVELDSDEAPLARDAAATVRTKTLLGEGYIELAPGNREAGTVPEGGRLATSQVRDRVQLDEFLATFDADARKGARRLLAGLARAYRGRGTELSGSLGRLAPASASLADVMAVLDSQRAELRRVVASSADVLDALAERQGAVRAAVTAGNSVLESTASRNRELAETIAALPAFLRQLEQTSGTLESASPELTRALAAVRKASPYAVPALKAIEENAPEFEGLFKRLPRTARRAETGLPATSRLAKASRPMLSTLYPALREVNPFLALFSANSKEITAVMANLASSTNGRLLGPGNQALPNAQASLFLGNETILGYKSRLPSNRLNPYIKPGGLNEMQKRGHLLSYDCRNVNNPLLVPVLGLGAPPCVEQGPWEFLGKTQYFPRLERADP